jgi:hypothetical protein
MVRLAIVSALEVAVLEYRRLRCQVGTVLIVVVVVVVEECAGHGEFTNVRSYSLFSRRTVDTYYETAMKLHGKRRWLNLGVSAPSLVPEQQAEHILGVYKELCANML